MWGLTRERDASFAQFAQDAAPSLTSTAWLVAGIREVARDLVQTALLKTYVAWPRIRSDDALAYARRVVVNTNIDRWRKRHGEVVSSDVVASRAPTSADAYGQVDDHDRVARMLAALPHQQRTVVILRYYADLSEREVADQLGISVGAVKSAASRGLATLRAHYAEEGKLP